MNITDPRFDYLFEFYGSVSAKVFTIYVWTVCSFVVVSNTFFISMTLTTESLRKNRANFLLVGFCLADTLHCSAHILDGVAIWTGSLTNRGLCQITGTLVVMTATSRFGFPALIAANRFYKISVLPGQNSNRCSIGRTLFAEKMIIPLIIGWFCFAYLLNVPLIITHSFGEDEAGFCGARKFTSIELLASYEMAILVVFVTAYSLAGVYYYRLAQWLHRHQSSENQNSVNYTRALMQVMKVETILPLLTESPVIVLTAGQMILPVLPMWLTRLLVAPYWLAACSTPWLTIALVRPFRRRFVQLISKAKATASDQIALPRISVSVRRTATVHAMQ